MIISVLQESALLSTMDELLQVKINYVNNPDELLKKI